MASKPQLPLSRIHVSIHPSINGGISLSSLLGMPLKENKMHITVFKTIFTVTQSLFIILALIAVLTDKQKDTRNNTWLFFVYYIVISSIGCIWGMWL